MTIAQLMLCTDLDRTLLPNGAQAESPQARQRFTALVAHPAITLVFVSGRDRALIEHAIAEYDLPQPDFSISDVGTNIYDVRNGDWQIWQQWQDAIAADWGGYSAEQLGELLVDFNELRLQEAGKQNTFKLSYYVPVNADNKRLHKALIARLRAHNIEASLTWSIDEPANTGLLDILPKRAGKLHAIEFLRASLGIALSRTVFAGDSGNDLPVLISAIPSVLVANASPSVAQAALAAAESGGNRHALYLARGDFLGMNGNYSAGILEGIAYYHPELIDLLSI